MVGLLLAAGASTRLGEPKQLLHDESGTPAVVRMARALRAAGCDPVLVIVGASAERVAEALSDEPVQIIVHTGWAAGMGSSIAAGIQAVRESAPAATGVLIAACDMPTVDVHHLGRLIELSEGAKRVASQYQHTDGDQVRGIPAVLPLSDWDWLAQLNGDRGARPLLQRHDTLTVSLRDGIFDLDTPDDVARWRSETKGGNDVMGYGLSG